jgi:hypothetical protein
VGRVGLEPTSDYSRLFYGQIDLPETMFNCILSGLRNSTNKSLLILKPPHMITMYRRWDSNPHGRNDHWILSPAWLPGYTTAAYSVRSEGFEPSRLSALVPKTSVATRLHHERIKKDPVKIDKVFRTVLLIIIKLYNHIVNLVCI